MMRWFRANRVFGGRLALLALAVQLVLSFGHIHREDIYGPARPTALAQVLAGDHAQQPADHSSKHSDDYCAICATISLLSTSFVAAPPLLPVPVAFHAVEHADRVAIASIALRRAPFQSRAPPQV
jgi:hypothetical protein